MYRKISLLLIIVFVQTSNGFSQSLPGSTWKVFDQASAFYVYLKFNSNTVSHSYDNVTWTNSSNYWVSGNSFKILGLTSSAQCPLDTGYYSFLIQNDTLKFTSITDPCTSRNQVHAYYHWVRLVTAIKEIDSDSKVKLFPNPTSSRVTLSGVEGQTVTLYNILGELIHTELLTATEDCTLDLSQQPNGIYFIKIGTATKKIIKQ